MIWFILGFGTMIGCLCGATVSNMFEEQYQKLQQRQQERK